MPLLMTNFIGFLLQVSANTTILFFSPSPADPSVSAVMLSTAFDESSLSPVIYNITVLSNSSPEGTLLSLSQLARSNIPHNTVNKYFIFRFFCAKIQFFCY